MWGLLVSELVSELEAAAGAVPAACAAVGRHGGSDLRLSKVINPLSPKAVLF